MFQISSDFLSMAGDAVVLSRGGRIDYANGPAEKLLGADCVGKSVRAVFGQDVAGLQAPAFVGDVLVDKRRLIVRCASDGGVRAIFLRARDDAPAAMGEAFICSLRNSLMYFGVAVETVRQRVEELGSPELPAHLASLTRSYYGIRRAISNFSAVHGEREAALCRSFCRFDLRALLKQLVEGVRGFIAEPQIIVPEGGPVPVEADPMLLEQLVLNLISNCVVHARGCTRISLGLIESGDSVTLYVDDDGCGIAPDGLFSSLDFYRVSAGANECGGAGLGLAAACAIARLHGGALTLESGRSRGTTVRVTLSRSGSPASLRSAGVPFVPSREDILTGLASCISDESFLGTL